MDPVSATIVGGLGYLGSRSSARMSQRNAREMMAFQDAQSRTQYQRAVADMRSAGLNPMLAAKVGGNAAMSGAMGSVPDFGNAIVSGINAGMNMDVAQANIRKTDAETARVQLDTKIKKLKDLPEATVKGAPDRVAAIFVNTIMEALSDDVSVLQGDLVNEIRSTFRYLKNESAVFASETMKNLAKEVQKAKAGKDNALVSSIKALWNMFTFGE